MSDLTLYDSVGNPQILVGDHIKVIGGVGFNQAWVDETLNRLIGEEYTNTTDKPIMISCGIDDGQGYVVLVVDGVKVARTVDGVGGFVSAIVPPGSTYEAENNGDPVLREWAELKAVSGLKTVSPLARTWQDLTTSREFEVEYMNDTGSDIMIAVTINSAAMDQSAVRILIGGVNVMVLTVKERDSWADTGVSLIVPSNTSYKVEASNGAPGLARWAELR